MPAPKNPLDEMAEKEKAANELAYSAVEAANGDVGKALHDLNRPGEYDRAKSVGLTFRHLEAAKQRFNDRLTAKTKPDDGHSLEDILQKASGGTPPAPQSKPATVNRSADNGKDFTLDQPPPTPRPPAEEKFTADQLRAAQFEVEEVERRIRTGAATVQDALDSPNVSTVAKAVLRTKYKPSTDR
jgi:hypothetical protein